MGMTDLQFKSFLKGLVSELKEMREKATDKEVVEKLDKMIARFESDIDS